MSTTFLLAAIGNVLATISIVPHLIEAIRTRKPGGSVTGWLLGAICGAIWIVYGILAGTPEVGAPGWVTVPIGAVLGFWILRNNRVEARTVAQAEARRQAMAAHPACARKADLVTAA